jgi:hypothetical protein
MTRTQLLFVIYDGIHNSVFQSQVLQPILQRLEETKDLEITLVSFEKIILPAHEIEKIITPHARLHVEILKRAPFVIRPLLYYCTHQFKKTIKDTLYSTITARGPIAGWIAMKAFKKAGLEKLTVQARGLCAQEFRFTFQHCPPTILKRLSYNFFYNTYEKIERDVYSICNPTPRLRLTGNIEAVSSALKQYLVEHFGADPKKITIATKDIPAIIDPQKIKAWKKEVREELQIPDEAYVYVYAGSARPWQCVEETLDWFKDQREHPFLLILTQDTQVFTKLIKEKNIPANSYIIKSVRPNDLYKYLAAANAGLMFRKKDIVNWVARPTKMLEYQSVGLEVVHNGNVGCLQKS